MIGCSCRLCPSSFVPPLPSSPRARSSRPAWRTRPTWRGPALPSSAPYASRSTRSMGCRASGARGSCCISFAAAGARGGTSLGTLSLWGAMPRRCTGRTHSDKEQPSQSNRIPEAIGPLRAPASARRPARRGWGWRQRVVRGLARLRARGLPERKASRLCGGSAACSTASNPTGIEIP